MSQPEDQILAKSSPGEEDLNARRLLDLKSDTSEINVNVPLTGSSPLRALAQTPPSSLPACVKRQVLRAAMPTTGPRRPPTPPYPNTTRLRFHFKTISLEDGFTYDDTKNHPKPMEIIVGKKFKMEVWELGLHTMVEGDVVKFLVPKELCTYYPMVSKVLRDNLKLKKESSRSCCGSLLSGTGYSDLDDLMKRPRSLGFILELLEASLPGEYEMESWYMTDDEKAGSITLLQDEGNKLFWNRHYKEASKKYMEGISRIELLMNKEVPGSEEMNDLKQRKVPLLLNYAFCKQKNRDYYEALRYNDLALEIEKDNVKGLFRRGQCQKFLGDFTEARKDLALALELDSTLKKTVQAEIEEIDVLEKGYVEAERIRCQKMFNRKK